MNRLLTRREVEQTLGVGKSFIYRRMAEGLFPRPVRLGAQCVRWRPEDIEEYIKNLERAGPPRVAGKP